MISTNTDIFKKLTLHSINQISNRVRIRKQKELQRISESGKQNVEVHLLDKLIEEEVNQADKRFMTGKTLPDRIKKKFPSELIGVPIEEIDEFQITEYVTCYI